MKRLLYLFLIFLVSCGDFGNSILDQQPETMISASNFWQTEEDLAASSRELHYRLRSCFSDVQNRLYRCRGTLFDYKGSLWNNISQNKLQLKWNLQAPGINWANEYSVISQANQILEYSGNADVSQERKDFYRGEALTVRAWVYFYILQTWGDAPLVTGAFDNGPRGKTAWQDIADYIIRDLREAATLLPPAGELDNKQIPSRGTANAVLAHVCARKGSLNNEPALLEEGIKAATAVISSGDYTLADSPHELKETGFKGGRETIWELVFDKGANELNVSGSQIAYACEAYPVIPNALPATKRSNFRLSNEKAKEIFNTCGTWFDEIFYNFDELAALPVATNQGAAYIWKFDKIIKYADGPQAGKIQAFDMNQMLLRLADIILLRAEMNARLGHSDVAVSDLNTIRDRCRAARYSAAEGDLLHAVFHQREQELFLEGIDIRFYDIVRNGIDFIHEYLGGNYKNVKSLEEVFLPVHSDAFYKNPLMQQNKYWQNFVQFRI